MILVRCKQCNTEVKSTSQTKTCGCPNMLTITGDTFSAVDLTSVIVVRSNRINKKMVLLHKILHGKSKDVNAKFAN